MSRFSVAPAARADLKEIWKNIARDNESAANRMRDRLQGAFFLLARNPQLGQLCEYLRMGQRFFCVGNYVVYYEANIRGVRILRVVHGARDVPRIP